LPIPACGLRRPGYESRVDAVKRIAIIGGGISGLSAAFSLELQRRRGVPIDYVVFESSERFGGVIRTERVNDCVVEAGPDSFLTEKPWAVELCRELGLGDQLIGSNDVGRKTYIVVKGRLVPLPDGLMFMVPTKLRAAFFSPLFSWRTKLRMIREWFYGSPRSSADSTVAEFVERHYGREMVDRLVDPLMAGVYGGSADELSVQSVMPRFAEIEAKHGSLGRTMVAASRSQSGGAHPIFTSLKDGMQQMTDALVSRIPASALRTNAGVESVRPESGKWLVVSAGAQTAEFDGVIIATPAYAAARLLGNTESELASELNAIRYSSSVTVALGYDQKTRAALPAGFGFLVPRSENHRLLAATFVQNKFPNRVPENLALIRCFLGGSRDEDILQCSDDELQNLIQREIPQILGFTAEPTFIRIYRWKRAMAQYTVGHGARVARIKDLITSRPGLAIAGNAYGGIGVPDCVRSGSEAAAKIMQGLRITQT
jgi:oxygen-dependent protoporphyrinogen oxidase